MEGTNLLGKSHKQYVQDQIRVRQEKLGKPTKSNNDISWLNDKTSWVRLASSVDIKNSPIGQETIVSTPITEQQVAVSPEVANSFVFEAFTPPSRVSKIDIIGTQGERRLKLLGLDESFMGSTLSQKLILHGGTESTNLGDNTLFKRSGISSNNKSFPQSTTAYTSKNGDFGLVAMPGIQSADVKSKSMGSLREANITIRVNDAEQLELIETLYLRLGYSLFLEWGNSSYYNNEGEYAKGASIQPTLLFDFLNPSNSLLKNPQNFIKKIEDQRKKSNGNYDALFGRVSNFSWEFDPSGFYNVSLTIISWGDVIESLSIDALYPSPVNTTNIEEKDNSYLGEFIYYSTTSSTTREKEYNKQEFVEISDYEDNAAKKKYAKELINQKVTSIVRKSLSSSNTGETDHSVSLNYTRPLDFKNIPLSVIAGFGPNTSYQYLRFGDLLQFINDKLLLYVEDSDEPIINIDTSNTNYCYNPGINVSANPSKVMIRRDFQLSSQALKGLNNVIREDGYDPSNFFRSKIFEGAIEGIDVELAPFDAKMEIESGKTDIDTDNDGVIDQKDVPTFKDIKVGNIMNIYLEKEFLYEQMSLNRDEESGKLSFYGFIKSLLDEINSCLGGVNKLDVRIVDDRTVQIYDQTPLYSVKNPNENPTVFNIYGLKKSTGEGSFVTNFGLKTELTNEFATTVTIGAQSNGSVVGEDATMLSKWNFGLIDRFYPKKLDSYRKSNQQEELDADRKEFEAITQKMLNLYADYSIQTIGSIEQTNQLGSKFLIKDLYVFPYFQTENYDQYVKTQKQFLQSIIKVESEKQKVLSNQIGMIPINLNLEMDGISGIRIYDQINVDTRFLPSYYPDNLIFIIKGLSQTFNGNRWITKIDTIAQPKVQFDKELDLSLISKDPEVESTFEEIAVDFIEASSSISNLLYPPEQEMIATNSSLSTFARDVYLTFETNNAVNEDIQIGVIFLAYQEQNFEGFNYNFYGVQTDIQWYNLEPYINGSFRSTEGEGGQGERNTDFRWFASFKSEREGIRFVAAALQRKNWGDISKSLEKGDTDIVAKKYFGSWLFGNPNSDIVKKFIKDDNGDKLSKWREAASAFNQAKNITTRE